jgi:hypothetical protein
LLGKFQLLVKRYKGGCVSGFLHELPVGGAALFKHIKFNIKLQYPFLNVPSIDGSVDGSIPVKAISQHPFLNEPSIPVKVISQCSFLNVPSIPVKTISMIGGGTGITPLFQVSGLLQSINRYSMLLIVQVSGLQV